ncbi:jg15873 [Pararge aegeria aegeria]|uniref:Jg15873 protein n=1 Tax=Pararge aegeria aegeria TaxID=348720 RepID=A0A8S4QY46_9NEOP|nr:jg15873 [Pararge aegeria aegeria]
MVKWQRTHNGQKLPKAEFSRIVGKVWEAFNPDIIKNGFAKMGVYPFNRDAVPEHKLDPDAVKRWKKMVAKKQVPPQNSPMTLTKLCLNKINFSFDLNTIPTKTSTSNINSKTTEIISFEDLFLETIKQVPNTGVKKKQVKISGSAEVITHEDVIARLKKKEDDKLNKEKEMEEKRKMRENKKKPKLKEKTKKQNKENKNDMKSKLKESTESTNTNLADPNTNEIAVPSSSSLTVHQNSQKPTTTKSVTHPNSKITVLQDIYLEPNEKVSREDIFFGQKPVQLREITLKTF